MFNIARLMIQFLKNIIRHIYTILFPRLFFPCYVYQHDNIKYAVLRSQFHTNCVQILFILVFNLMMAFQVETCS
jgi:hypothetical protein